MLILWQFGCWKKTCLWSQMSQAMARHGSNPATEWRKVDRRRKSYFFRYARPEVNVVALSDVVDASELPLRRRSCDRSVERQCACRPETSSRSSSNTSHWRRGTCTVSSCSASLAARKTSSSSSSSSSSSQLFEVRLLHHERRCIAWVSKTDKKLIRRWDSQTWLDDIGGDMPDSPVWPVYSIITQNQRQAENRYDKRDMELYIHECNLFVYANNDIS